jgi:hypothetical protein
MTRGQNESAALFLYRPFMTILRQFQCIRAYPSRPDPCRRLSHSTTLAWCIAWSGALAGGRRAGRTAAPRNSGETHRLPPRAKSLWRSFPNRAIFRILHRHVSSGADGFNLLRSRFSNVRHVSLGADGDVFEWAETGSFRPPTNRVRLAYNARRGMNGEI